MSSKCKRLIKNYGKIVCSAEIGQFVISYHMIMSDDVFIHYSWNSLKKSKMTQMSSLHPNYEESRNNAETTFIKIQKLCKSESWIISFSRYFSLITLTKERLGWTQELDGLPHCHFNQMFLIDEMRTILDHYQKVMNWKSYPSSWFYVQPYWN